MQSKHLQTWLVTATREEFLDTENWYRVVELIQTSFWEVRLPEECAWEIVLLIPKGNR